MDNNSKKFSVDKSQIYSLVKFANIGFALYNAYVIYAALVPLSNWAIPKYNIVEHILFDWVNKVYLFDIVQNILFYLPFGFLYAISSYGENRKSLALLCLIFFYCLIISSSLELFQAYNPKRSSSLVDVIFNVTGGLIGTCIILSAKEYWLKFFIYVKNNILKKISYISSFCYLAIASWACLHLYSFLPSLSPGVIKHGLLPIKTYWPYIVNGDLTALSLNKTIINSITGAGLVILAYGCINKFRILIISLFIIAVLSFKILIMGRAPTIEEYLGTIIGAWLTGSLIKLILIKI